MSVSSPEYLLVLFLVAAVFFQIPGIPLRRWAFALGAGGFFLSHVTDLRAVLVIMAFLLSGYVCARLLLERPSRTLFTCYLILLVGSFAFLKQYVFLAPLVPQRFVELHLELVGLSYMLFRQIHFIVDVMQGQIERPSAWCYFNYQLNPFTFLAGPIQRYQDFEEYWASLTPLVMDRHDLLKSYLRIFIGILKIVLLAALFHRGYDHFLAELDATGPASQTGLKAVVKLALMLYCFFFYLYLNFSGYCDVVIAGASLIGLCLPENFNHPLAARNILDYWTRWHVTLGQWIRDYLFTPFYKAGAERFPRHVQAVAVVSYFLAFTVVGVWHGSTANFLVFGVLQGVGASAAKAWENLIVARSGRAGLRNYLKSPTIRGLAVLGTFHYNCFSLLLFALDLPHAQRILMGIARSFTAGY